MNEESSTKRDEAEAEPPHRGYDFESGMFSRVREWPDLLPWVRLARVLRLAVSPPLLLLVTLVCSVQAMVGPLGGVHDQSASTATPQESVTAQENVVAGGASIIPPTLEGFGYRWAPTTLFEPIMNDAWYVNVLRLLFLLLSWTTVAIVLIRQGALLVAGRGLATMRSTFALAVPRTWRCWTTALVPLVCVGFLAVLAFVAAWVASRVPDWNVVHWMFAIVIGLIAIPIGILGFGQVVAIPLGWAAMVCEPDPDPLDSLSRGYEYLYRRPIHLVFYVGISVALIWLAHFVASGVAGTGIWVTEAVVAMAIPGAPDRSDPIEFFDHAVLLLEQFPRVIVITMAWGSVGGVYLLLRRDAGNQEVEDVWIPVSAPGPSLPQLPKNQL